MLRWLMANNEQLKDIGLLLMRVGLGFIFIKHGSGKLFGGPAQWASLGGAMKNFGIIAMPALWGLAAACAEFFGGSLLILGLATRVAAFFIACVMVVAFVMHTSKGDPFTTSSHPLSLLVVLIGLMITGGGFYALDRLITQWL